MSETALRAGDIVGAGWRLEEVVREGASGTVFRATDLRLGRTVALKTLSGDGDPTWLQRLQREATLLARLDNPHIVALHHFGQHEDVPFLVMQFVEGQSLAELVLQRGGLTPREVLPIAEQICAALSYLHERNLLHRDLKPANIMVSPRGHVTLIDLGVARTHDSRLTRTGVVHGTPGYLAPEVILSDANVDARADLYSLGVLLFELLTGTLPFAGLRDDALLRAHLTQERPLAHRVRPGLSAALSQALARAMAIKPEDRFPTAALLMSRVREGLSATPEPRRNEEPATTPMAALVPDGPTAPGRPPLALEEAPVPPSGRQRQLRKHGAEQAGRSDVDPGRVLDAPTAAVRPPAAPLGEAPSPPSDRHRAARPGGEAPSAGGPRRPSADQVAALPIAERPTAPPRAALQRPESVEPSAVTATPTDPAPAGVIDQAQIPTGPRRPLSKEDARPVRPARRKALLLWGGCGAGVFVVLLAAVLWPSEQVGPPPAEPLPLRVIGMEAAIPVAPPAPPPVEVASTQVTQELEARRAAIPTVEVKPRPQLRRGPGVPPRKMARKHLRSTAFAGVAQLTLVATYDDRPVSAQVEIDGVWRGATPLELSLAAGEHRFRIDYPRTKVTEFATDVMGGRAVRLEVELRTPDEARSANPAAPEARGHGH